MRYASMGYAATPGRLRIGLVLAAVVLMAVVLMTAVGCARDTQPPPMSTRSQPPSSLPGHGPTSSQPTRTATVPATAAGTVTQTAARQAVPLAARAHSDAGAEAFVRFYIDQLNLSWTSPRAGLLAPLSDPGCQSCRSLQATAERLAESHRRYVSAPVSIRSVNAFPGAPAGQQLVHVVMDQHRVDVVDAGGVLVATDPAKELTRNVALSWRGDAWLVYGFAE